MTLEEAKKAVDKYFSDTSRSKSETKRGLFTLIEEIEIMIDSLKEEEE
jgi:hypothetical protein